MISGTQFGFWLVVLEGLFARCRESAASSLAPAVDEEGYDGEDDEDGSAADGYTCDGAVAEAGGGHVCLTVECCGGCGPCCRSCAADVVGTCARGSSRG